MTARVVKRPAGWREEAKDYPEHFNAGLITHGVRKFDTTPAASSL